MCFRVSFCGFLVFFCIFVVSLFVQFTGEHYIPGIIDCLEKLVCKVTCFVSSTMLISAHLYIDL